MLNQWKGRRKASGNAVTIVVSLMKPGSQCVLDPVENDVDKQKRLGINTIWPIESESLELQSRSGSRIHDSLSQYSGRPL